MPDWSALEKPKLSPGVAGTEPKLLLGGVITKPTVMDWSVVELPVVPVEPVDAEFDELLIVIVPEQSGFTEYVPVKAKAL